MLAAAIRELTLRSLIILTIALRPATGVAQAPVASPRHGWFVAIRAGLGFGRATCDSPCYSPRSRFGPRVNYVLGHTMGDRSTAGVSFGEFSGQWSAPRDTWTLGGLGIEVGARPSPTSNTLASMELGVGGWEREPKRGGQGTFARVAQWRLGVAYDDPVRSSLGVFGDLHGSVGGSISNSPSEDGSRVSAVGFSAGPTYVRR